MRKLIDIPDEVAKELNVQAAKEGTNLKNYLENLIINHSKKVTK